MGEKIVWKLLQYFNSFNTAVKHVIILQGSSLIRLKHFHL